MTIPPFGLRGLPLALWALLTAGGDGSLLARQYGDWQATVPPLVHRGTDLYTFMDGGAEIYFEYGFERLESQSYELHEEEIAVELYRLRDDAYGLYTFLRASRCETPAVGDVACLAEHYLLFAKGPYLCAVTAQSAFPGMRNALLEIAGPIAERLDGAARRPPVFDLLPQEDRLAGSEKQLRGPIGLSNVSHEAGRLFRGFSDGASAAFGPSVTGGLLAWNGPSEAEAAWRQALDRLERDGTWVASETAEAVSRCEGLRCFGAERAGAFVVFAAAESRSRAAEWTGRLKAGVAGQSDAHGGQSHE